MDKSFFTYASGRKYLAFAFTLARSYKFHNKEGIPFYIVSDGPIDLPKDLNWVKTKIISQSQRGTGLEFKLSFYDITDTTHAIFIDADSVIYGNISSLFDDIKNTSVNVLGLKIREGKWVNIDSTEALANYNIPYLIRYCGAFYYIIKNKVSEQIFEFAKDLLKEKEKFHQHAFGVNEEPLLSISMAIFGVEPFPDSGNIWTDLVQFESHKQLNVFSGRPHFQNDPNNRNFKFWIPKGSYSPLIIHMGGGSYNKNPWLFDSLRLKFYYQLGLSKTLSNSLVASIVQPGYFALKKLKSSI